MLVRLEFFGRSAHIVFGGSIQARPPEGCTSFGGVLSNYALYITFNPDRSTGPRKASQCQTLPVWSCASPLRL
jgi:hypothetical protein